MNFSIRVQRIVSKDSTESLGVVNFDTVTFEVIRHLQTKECPLTGRLFSPIKQYFIEIHQNDDGPIPNIRLALAAAMNALYNSAGHVGVFTLWIKGRRYSQFSCSPDDWDKFREELFAEVDSDMAFNREEWGLTEKQRRAKSENKDVA